MAEERSENTSGQIHPAVGLTVAATAWLLGAERIAVLALVGTTVQAQAALFAPAATRAFTKRVIATVHIVIQATLGTAAWIIIVLPAWAASRVVGLHDLRDGTGWKAPGGRAPHRVATRAFALDAPASPRRRTRAAAATVIAAAVLATAVWAATDRTQDPTRTAIDAAAAGNDSLPGPVPVDIGSDTFDKTAFEGQPNADEMIRDLVNTPLQFDPAFGHRVAERNLEWVKVKDRERHSYEPDDPVRRVWFIGGSSAFGVGQRDEFTIPSEMAKLSEQEGTPVEFENFGVSAYNVLQESQLLAYLLATRPRPDLIVVYDGFNDSTLAIRRIAEGDPHLGEPVGMLSAQIEDRLELDELDQIQQPTPRPNTYGDDAQAAVDLGIDQYQVGASAIRVLAKGAGVPVVFAWQPDTASLDPVPAASQPLVDQLYKEDFDKVFTMRIAAAIRAGAVPESVDLSAALNGVDEPLYLDAVHTNERGAKIIAAELWAPVRQALGLER